MLSSTQLANLIGSDVVLFLLLALQCVPCPVFSFEALFFVFSFPAQASLWFFVFSLHIVSFSAGTKETLTVAREELAGLAGRTLVT